jgi:hypothetical protein
MSPKEKALELFYKFSKEVSREFNSDSFISATIAKQCALIAVDEILYNDSLIKTLWDIDFWNEVKKEIEKL